MTSFLAEQSLLISLYPMRYFDQIRIFASYTAAIHVGLAVIERAISTVNMHTYETRHHSIILFGVIGSTYIFGAYASYNVFKCKKNLNLFNKCIF